MTRIAYIHPSFVPLAEAVVPMEDRAHHFADAVYEVIALYDGRFIDAEAHLARMQRSLNALNIPMPMSLRAFKLKLRELVRRDRRRNALIYIQVSRGVAARGHIPPQNIQPMLSMAIYPAKYPTAQQEEQGVSVITVQDQRWARCDIKSTSLLPNVLARIQAHQAQAKEAWQFNANDELTEGSLSNAFIVKDGTLYTHPANEHILGGVTRDVVLQCAQAAGMAVQESAPTRQQVLTADEAFMTGASTFVLPVVKVDQTIIGIGQPGSVTKQLIAAYKAHIDKALKELPL